MQPEIKNIRLDRILPNPHRDILNYPISEEKVDALVRSIISGDVGLWPSIIGRPVKGGYEQAFGHHRTRAAERAGLTTIPLIVMDLSDEQMLKYMARENSEDFGTEFIVSLNTWEAGFNYLSREKVEPQPVEIARLFGWVVLRPSDNNREVMTHTANACSLAFRLIQAGQMDRQDFAGLTTHAARQIADRAVSYMTTLDKAREKGTMNPKHVEAAKTKVGKAAKKTAKQVRSGEVAKKDVRSATEKNIFMGGGSKRTNVPQTLIDKFCYRLCADINAMLSHDKASRDLAEVHKVLPQLTLNADHVAVGAVAGSLLGLNERSRDWHNKFRAENRAEAVDPKVTPLLTKRGE